MPCYAEFRKRAEPPPLPTKVQPVKKSPMAVVMTGFLVALGAASCAAPSSTAPGAGAGSGPAAPQASASASPVGGTPEDGSYSVYTPEAVSSASETENVVLFFHATWCSTCKLLARDIEANAARIPANVRILRVDFDSETALKQKYGVTLQHTLVQVRPDGTQLAKWSLSRNLDDLVREIR